MIELQNTTLEKEFSNTLSFIDKYDSSMTPNKTTILQKSALLNGNLIFENGDSGFDLAIEDGIFLIRIPEELCLSNADLFAKNFYKNSLESNQSNTDKYRGYRTYTSESFVDPLLGFHQRKDQIEQFLLEKRFWNKFYPPEITKIGEYLCHLSSKIIVNIFLKIGLPEHFWEKATGGCSHGEGSYHLTFNHFRPEKETRGLSAHKDDGFTTILRSIKPGLEINRNGSWESVTIEPKYFIVNFGLSMELLTKEAKIPVAAITHRVVQQNQQEGEEDRWSWGHFSSSHFDENIDRGIYSYSHNNCNLRRLSDSREHIDNNDREIYK